MHQDVKETKVNSDIRAFNFVFKTTSADLKVAAPPKTALETRKAMSKRWADKITSTCKS